jgi:hypothetical protein
VGEANSSGALTAGKPDLNPLQPALNRLQTPLVLVDHLTCSHRIRIKTIAPQLNPGATLHSRRQQQFVETVLDRRRPLTIVWLAYHNSRLNQPQSVSE